MNYGKFGCGCTSEKSKWENIWDNSREAANDLSKTTEIRLKQCLWHVPMYIILINNSK